MHALSTHLRQPVDHARLSFHPDCPICRRQRLAGRVPTDELLSRRTVAVAAVGALMTSSLPVAPALASRERDQTTIGEQPEAPASDPALNPDFDPGGDTEVLGDDGEAPGPEGDGSPTAPVEAEPVSDNVPVSEQADALPAPEVAPAPPESASATPEPLPAPPAPTAPESLQPPPADSDLPADSADSALGFGESLAQEREQRRKSSSHEDSSREPTRRSQPAQADSTPEPEPSGYVEPVIYTQVAAAPVTNVVEGAGGVEQPRDGRIHVVQPGESLWAIAQARLGADAGAPALAREVSRLWQLNRAQIGTGDPDLLPVGTELRLR
jgi:hypothetical protein